MTVTVKPMLFKREIKSFVRRQRRITPRLQKAYDLAWPKFGITVSDAPLDLENIFGRKAARVCEIGFGSGDTLLPMAKENPDGDYLGIEVHEPGVAEVMFGIIENNLTNIRVIKNDAVKILRDFIADNAFSRIHIYFPDPWPKKKHRKRRLIQDDFVDLLIRKLTSNGVLHVATDWENYAEQMMHILSAKKALKNCMGENQFADNASQQLRVESKFSKRGAKLGHGVWDLLFLRQ